MKVVYRIVVFLVGLVCTHASVSASSYLTATDSLRASELLAAHSLSLKELPAGKRILAISDLLAGIPAAELTETQTDTVGYINMRFTAFDPLQFVNTVLAVNRNIEVNNGNMDALPDDYAEYARRKGKQSADWMSHFLFPADWLNDNLFRRSLKEVTADFGQTLHETSRTIDYITANRADFKALKDSALYDRVRHAEMGYVMYPIRYLPLSSFSKSTVKDALREGDILVIYSSERNIDSRDIAFVRKSAGEPYIIHVSPYENKVCTEQLPLDKYLKRNVKRISGVRVFRLPQIGCQLSSYLYNF